MLPIQDYLTTVNFTAMTSKVNKYIVIHYTGNKGDTAKANCSYFASVNRSASANYFVDDSSIYCCVKPTNRAWHCGGGMQSNNGGSIYGKCTNSNSIGIEMCLWDKQGNERADTITNTVALTQYLMATYNIDVDHVVRHWDVVGKDCPSGWTGNDNAKWKAFKSRLIQTEELTMTQYEELKSLIDALQKESNRKNEIINTMGTEIQDLKNGQEDLKKGHDKQNDLLYDIRTKVGV